MKRKSEFTVVRGTNVGEFQRRTPEPLPPSPLKPWQRLLAFLFIFFYGYGLFRFVKLFAGALYER